LQMTPIAGLAPLTDIPHPTAPVDEYCAGSTFGTIPSAQPGNSGRTVVAELAVFQPRGAVHQFFSCYMAGKAAPIRAAHP
jgi:hypothetical protein